MKKTIFLALFAVLVSLNAYAKSDGGCDMSYGKGGFMDTNATPMSIAEVMKMPDDSYVTLQGYITKRVGDKKYHFSDGTTEIPVEISHKVWQGQTVTPKDKVMIFGEIDREDGQRIIEVKSLMVAPK